MHSLMCESCVYTFVDMVVCINTPILYCLSTRSPSSPITDGEFSNSSPDNSHPVTTLDNYMEKNQGNATFPAEVTTEEQVADSKALVLVPERDAEVLSMVPLSEKPPKRFEYSQRRTRRPFSVSEVEALVEAVETLGAGRFEHHTRNLYFNTE